MSPLMDRLAPDQRVALTALRDEIYPGYTLDAVATKLLRDALIGCGVLALPRANRSCHAGSKRR